MTTGQHRDIRQERAAELEAGAAGLQAEHDVTKQELIQTLDELMHRADIPERSRQAARNAVMRTQSRAERAVRQIATPPRLLSIALVFATSCAIAYALTRTLRRRRFIARHPLRALLR
ncbi:hypothetical protein GCM10011581_28060 [Saccharopolyspora subtropica]|uniref:DUF3618 domain-containing protein n=1 Tax=Saccharopolyspora thermophila TaxID=89367 RepID=A0A917JVU3_9PSEU|nr:hypothetical protein [Saccharopolyspora subtropica]GGI89388.1 hypothetical protein GCM10011581_28060 [Saccharopolyspora subtropica]